LAFRLTIANPEKDDPLQGQGIVIIDEIDLHLHPQWQRRIIPQLRKTFPNIQFIVTTHSPLVLESLDLDNIIVLDNGKIIDPIVSPKGREVGEILEEIMGESAVAIQDNINHYFALISENKFDEAEIYKNEVLLKLTDRENPIFYQADAIITRKRILAK